MPKSFNLREWQDAHGLTAQQLTDYLNGLGCPVARKTVEGWHGKGCPKWLPPLLRQRDGLNELYARFDTVHDSVILTGMALMTGELSKLEKNINLAGDACDKMETIFGQYLTDAERGE